MSVKIGEMDFDEGIQTVSGPMGTVRLTKRECALLACLAGRVGEVVPRNDLLAEAWGWRNVHDVRTKTVDVHVGRLRGKLERVGLDPGMVRAVRYKGYLLKGAEGDE